MKIEPRKPSDRGGWLCMPRLENCPEGKPGWGESQLSGMRRSMLEETRGCRSN